MEEEAAVKEYLALDEEKQKEARAEAEIQEREAIAKEQENIIAEELLQIYRWLEKRELEDQKEREEKKKRREEWLRKVAESREKNASREEWLRKVAESREKNAINSKIRKPYTKVEVYSVTAPGIITSGEQYRYLLTVEREPQKR